MITGQSNYTVFRYTTTGLTACEKVQSTQNTGASEVITKSFSPSPVFPFPCFNNRKSFYAEALTKAAVVTQGHAAVSLAVCNSAWLWGSLLKTSLTCPHSIPRCYASPLRKFIESQCIFITFMRTNWHWEPDWCARSFKRHPVKGIMRLENVQQLG